MPLYQVRKASASEQACRAGKQNGGVGHAPFVTGIPICIFAKPPVPGQVKTRLAQSIGPAQSAKLAAAMLRDVWSVVATLPEAIPVLAASDAGDFAIDVPAEKVWLQQPGDLGLRIECILQRALETTPAAIALGADTPLVTAVHLAEAFDCLKSEDAVIGPCDDGGFYLLGVRRCPPGLLAGINWSTEHTLRETELRLRAHGMNAARIPTLSDVDTVADLQRLCSELRSSPLELAPQTRQWLDETTWSAS